MNALKSDGKQYVFALNRYILCIVYGYIYILGTNSSEEQRTFNTKGTAPEKSR